MWSGTLIKWWLKWANWILSQSNTETTIGRSLLADCPHLVRSSQTLRPGQLHIYFREGKCRVALILLLCFMAWVSNHTWYLAITKSITVSLGCFYLFMMDMRPDIKPKSDRSFRMLLPVCIRWCFEESSVRKRGCRGGNLPEVYIQQS